METRQHKLAMLIKLIESQAPQDGIYPSYINDVYTARTSQSSLYGATIYQPGIIIVAQGEKHTSVNGKRYTYKAGNFLTVLLPMPAEVEVSNATPEEPFLALGLYVDLNRLVNMIHRMEMADPLSIQSGTTNASGIFAAPISDKLLDASIRLLTVLSNSVEAAILGDSIIEEIYFRILNEEAGGMLKYLLQQRGQIRQISRAIEYIHQNLNQSLSVDVLAELVNMSVSGFHRKFKEVLHLSPIQYIKSIRLNKARTLILDGESVSEAAYAVGYNSPAQFSREYKRLFGYTPSFTQVAE